MREDENWIMDAIRELKNDIREWRLASEADYKNLDARMREIEASINIVKSVFTHWKFWTFFIIIIALIDPHPIIQYLKSITDIFK